MMTISGALCASPSASRAAASANSTALTTPVEVLGGFKWNPKFGFNLGAAGSTDVTDGYGAPDWRVIGMVGFTMPEKTREPDADGDHAQHDCDDDRKLLALDYPVSG